MLAQYPHESETLFGPLTGIEVLGTRIDGTVVVIECSFSVNLMALTIEQVIGKMQAKHISLVSTMLGELKHCAPAKALAPLQAVLEDAKRRGHQSEQRGPADQERRGVAGHPHRGHHWEACDGPPTPALHLSLGLFF